METIEKSKVFVASEMVDYSSGAIVSKVIAKQQGGNLTLFAFDKGQGLSEHSAPFDAMVQVLDGEAEIIINNRLHHLNSGQCIIMPANVPHAVHGKERFKMLLTMVKD